MRQFATSLASSLFLLAACAHNPKPATDAAVDDSAFTPIIGQPAESDLLTVLTSQPSYAEVVFQSRGESALTVAEGEGGPASGQHRFLKPASLMRLGAATSLPRQCYWGSESEGLDVNGRRAYRKAITCNPATSTAAGGQPKLLPAFAIAIVSSQRITQTELDLAAAIVPDLDPQQTAKRIVQRLSSNDPDARWAATVRQMSY